MSRSSELQRKLDFWLGIPLIQLVGRLRRGRERPRMLRRIGLISPSAIGDLILQSGLIAHLGRSFPDAELHLFVGHNNAPAAALLATPVIAHCLSFGNPLRAARQIRELQLDLLIDLTPWPRATALAAFLAGPYTIGFDSRRQGRAAAFDLAVPHLNDRHEVENLNAMASAVAECNRYAPALRAGSTRHTARSGPVLLHMFPGGSRAFAKSWPEDNWVELALNLNSRGVDVAFTGSKADASRVSVLIEKLVARGGRAISLAGKLSLCQLAETLSCTPLLITVDTAILHLGAALGTPTIGLHGPTRAARWGGYGPSVTSVETPHPAAGYIHLGFETHPLANQLMPAITVERVLAEAQERLRASVNGKGPPSPGTE